MGFEISFYSFIKNIILSRDFTHKHFKEEIKFQTITIVAFNKYSNIYKNQ